MAERPYFVHVSGPDNLVLAPSKTDADAFCKSFNDWIAKQMAKDPTCEILPLCKASMQPAADEQIFTETDAQEWQRFLKDGPG